MRALGLILAASTHFQLFPPVRADDNVQAKQQALESPVQTKSIRPDWYYHKPDNDHSCDNDCFVADWNRAGCEDKNCEHIVCQHDPYCCDIHKKDTGWKIDDGFWDYGCVYLAKWKCECPSEEPSARPSEMPSERPSAMPSQQPTEMPSLVPSQQPSKMPSEQPTEMPSLQPSQQPSKMPSEEPSELPSEEPTKMPSEQPSEVPTKMPSELPSEEPTKMPSEMPSEEPTKMPSEMPSEEPTKMPSELPSEEPTKMPSELPSEEPTKLPSEMPSEEPTKLPSELPSEEPTKMPSELPSEEPSEIPSIQPSETPSEEPSDDPTKAPTDDPSVSPSARPTNGDRTRPPTDDPSISPSNLPSEVPTMAPTDYPSLSPSAQPSDDPTKAPTDDPSVSPSAQPSDDPTMAPTDVPSVPPSAYPSDDPTRAPTDDPSVPPSAYPSNAPTPPDPTRHPTDEPHPSGSGDECISIHIDCVPTPSPTPTSPTSPSVDDCDKPLMQLNLRYLGTRCGQSMNDQENDKWNCEDKNGGPNQDEKVVMIEATTNDKDSNFGVFSKKVTLGELFELPFNEKYGSETSIVIKDSLSGIILQELEIHTSCSQNLFIGDIFGGVRVAGWIDDNGSAGEGRFPFGTPISSGDNSCDCEKPLQKLSMEFIGGRLCEDSVNSQPKGWGCEQSGAPPKAPVRLVVFNKRFDNDNGEEYVISEDNMRFDLPKIMTTKGYGSETECQVYGADGTLLERTFFHTSCSKDLAPEDIFGNFKVISFIDDRGLSQCGEGGFTTTTTTLPPDEHCNILPVVKDTNCPNGFERLTMRYEALSCADDDRKGGDHSCEDFASSFPGKVKIVVSEENRRRVLKKNKDENGWDQGGRQDEQKDNIFWEKNKNKNTKTKENKNKGGKKGENDNKDDGGNAGDGTEGDGGGDGGYDDGGRGDTGGNEEDGGGDRGGGGGSNGDGGYGGDGEGYDDGHSSEPQTFHGVKKGSEFTFDVTNKNMMINVFHATTGALLQHLMVHMSCSQDLHPGYRVGSIRAVTFLDDGNDVLSTSLRDVTLRYTVKNGGKDSRLLKKIGRAITQKVPKRKEKGSVKIYKDLAPMSPEVFEDTVAVDVSKAGTAKVLAKVYADGCPLEKERYFISIGKCEKLKNDAGPVMYNGKRRICPWAAKKGKCDTYPFIEHCKAYCKAGCPYSEY